jgi:hypothetical protein
VFKNLGLLLAWAQKDDRMTGKRRNETRIRIRIRMANLLKWRRSRKGKMQNGRGRCLI